MFKKDVAPPEKQALCYTPTDGQLSTTATFLCLQSGYCGEHSLYIYQQSLFIFYSVKQVDSMLSLIQAFGQDLKEG